MTRPNIRTEIRYDFVSYQNDTASAVLANPFLLAGLYSEITDLTDQLFQNGSISFLSGGKPILYGIDGNDTINGTVSTTGVDLAEQRYLKNQVNNGLQYVSGNGNDTIIATDNNDILIGGADDDTLIGGKGSDILEGGTGADTYIINPGDGIDTVLDTDGLGAIQLGSVTVQGKDSVTADKDWIKIGGSWIDR